MSRGHNFQKIETIIPLFKFCSDYMECHLATSAYKISSRDMTPSKLITIDFHILHKKVGTNTLNVLPQSYLLSAIKTLSAVTEKKSNNDAGLSEVQKPNCVYYFGYLHLTDLSPKSAAFLSIPCSRAHIH